MARLNRNFFFIPNLQNFEIFTIKIQKRCPSSFLDWACAPHKNLYKKSVLLQKTEINPINCLESKSLMIYHLTDKSLDHIFGTIFLKFQLLNVLLAIFPIPHAQKVKANSILNCIESIQTSYTLKRRLFTYSIILISECNCNDQGSIDNTCDFNGRCYCQAGFFSNKCEEGTIFIIL